MNLAGALFLLLTHFLTGKGVIRLFRVQLEPIATLCFSMLCGVFVASLVPCIMQFAHVPFTANNIYIWLGATAGLFSIPLLINIKNTKLPKVTLPNLYEVPFILVFVWLAFISVWRCFYFPVTPRDMLTGPELIAEFAVREKTMINSVFSIDLRMHADAANNIFKSPFITALQIIYKLLVHPFGQEWLSVIFLSFTLWFYTILRTRIHPFLAGILLLIFFCMPDLFAYTYLALYDYGNMVFFFAGSYFLASYLESDRLPELVWASFLLGIATYIRTETLIIVALACPVLALYYFRRKAPLKKAALTIGLCMASPILFNFLCSGVFVKHFVPLDFKLGNLINNPFDLSAFFQKLSDIATKLMFAEKAQADYADFFVIFFSILVIDIIWPRKYNREARIALIGAGLIYIGLAIVAYLFKATTIENTVKRGLFKLLPFMVWYMANSGLLQKLSDYLKKRELGKTSGPSDTPQVKAVPVPKPKPVPQPPRPQQGKNKR